jgi:diphthine-ammonia ligase
MDFEIYRIQKKEETVVATQPKHAAVLWTGGKDSALAYYEAGLAGCTIARLVTFVPENPSFRAHPLEVMRYQAQALDLPHEVIQISKPYNASYTAAISALHEQQGIDALITGDIAEVDHQPNWIRECSQGTGVEVITPLWDYDRKDLLDRLISTNFKVIFSCVKLPWLGADWLGREINSETLEELSRLSASNGLDICGENGEFHTLTLDAPLFKKRIKIDFQPASDGEVAYIKVQQVALLGK